MIFALAQILDLRRSVHLQTRLGWNCFRVRHQRLGRCGDVTILEEIEQTPDNHADDEGSDGQSYSRINDQSDAGVGGFMTRAVAVTVSVPVTVAMRHIRPPPPQCER